MYGNDGNDPLGETDASQRWLDQQWDSSLNRDGPLDGIRPLWDGTYQYLGGAPSIEAAREGDLDTTANGGGMPKGDESSDGGDGFNEGASCKPRPGEAA